MCVVLDSNFNVIHSWNYHDTTFIYHSVLNIYEDHLGRVWLSGAIGDTTNKQCIVLDSNFTTFKS